MIELIEAYDAYIKLLEDEERGLIGLAMVHGYRCPQHLIDRGAELRAKIAALKSANKPSATAKEE